MNTVKSGAPAEHRCNLLFRFSGTHGTLEHFVGTIKNLVAPVRRYRQGRHLPALTFLQVLASRSRKRRTAPRRRVA